LYGGWGLLPGHAPELEAEEVLGGGLSEEEDLPQTEAVGLPQRPAGQMGSESPSAVVRVYGQGAQQAVQAVTFEADAASHLALVEGHQEGVEVVSHAVERQAAKGEQIPQRREVPRAGLPD
jgi:hypothetical protein